MTLGGTNRIAAQRVANQVTGSRGVTPAEGSIKPPRFHYTPYRSHRAIARSSDHRTAISVLDISIIRDFDRTISKSRRQVEWRG